MQHNKMELVRIQGMKSAAYNGKMARVLPEKKADAAEGRIPVFVWGLGKEAAIKTENLQELEFFYQAGSGNSADVCGNPADVGSAHGSSSSSNKAGTSTAPSPDQQGGEADSKKCDSSSPKSDSKTVVTEEDAELVERMKDMIAAGVERSEMAKETGTNVHKIKRMEKKYKHIFDACRGEPEVRGILVDE
jgi:hypothetical protein